VQVTPLWPNLQEIPKILGASVQTVPLEFSPSGWTLPLDKLIAALKPGTRALYLNSPNNPTGWTVSRDELKAILEHCRKHGIWMFSDDAYERLYYGEEGIAPSLLDISSDEDRLISANTFSKSWLMTGWRLGWLVVPESLTADLGKLIEYNTSCAPVFVQRAGIAAVKEGEPVIARTRYRFRKARDFLVPNLKGMPRNRSRATRRHHVRVLQGRRREGQPGVLQEAGARSGPWPGARLGFRAGGRGLRALVLCSIRRKARRRRRAPEKVSLANKG
jgi:aspartate/methionine/tyrosine aminotransferase